MAVSMAMLSGGTPLVGTVGREATQQGHAGMANLSCVTNVVTMDIK